MGLGSTFKVSEYITLKLESGKTNIYVKNELFQQCKKIILYIDKDEFNSYDNAKSIDDITELREDLLSDVESKRIPPELEFWGHCSNIQAWVENNYNTNLLHSNLSFPLLKKLSEVGNLKAKKVFKGEVLRRLEIGSDSVVHFLLENYYLENFTKDELLIIYEDILPRFKSSKLLLPFLRAFSFQGLPNARKYYKNLVKELVLTKNFHEKKEILNEHAGILSEHDLIYLFEKLKSEETNNSEISDRFEVINLIMDILQSQYDANFKISDIITILLRKDEQEIISKIFLGSHYPYMKLDFQADVVRRRVWDGRLYYEFFGGNIVSLELLCDDSNEEVFYENLEAINSLKELRHLNLLFLCRYKYNVIRNILLRTNIEKIRIYEFFNGSYIPKLRIIRN